MRNPARKLPHQLHFLDLLKLLSSIPKLSNIE